MTTQAQVQGLGQFGRQAFTLEHDGATAVFLFHEGQLVSRFSQTGATEEGIQRECALHLAKCHGWEGCLWTREEEANHG
jgi:hypothetical protein